LIIWRTDAGITGVGDSVSIVVLEVVEAWAYVASVRDAVAVIVDAVVGSDAGVAVIGDLVPIIVVVVVEAGAEVASVRRAIHVGVRKVIG
jgi:hypothetical protein